MAVKSLVRGWQWALFVVPSILVILSLAARLSWRWLPNTLIRYFDVTAERSVPTWYASSLLLTAGLIAAGVYLAVRRKVSVGERLTWLGVAALLLVMSLDELVSIHEQVGRSLRPFVTGMVQQVAGSSLDGILRTGWIVPGIVVVVVLAAFMTVGYRVAPRRLRFPFVMGFAILVLGALGLEMVGSLVYEHPIPLLFASHAEELLEMYGGAVMLLAIWRCLELERSPDQIMVRYRA